MRLFFNRWMLVAGLLLLPMVMSPRLGSGVPGPDYARDPRLYKIRTFFSSLDCPAWRYAATFLEAADDYALDWRLLPSLSYVETTGGKAAPNNNLFGWGSGRAKFSSPHAAIHTIAFHLTHAEHYRNKSLDALLWTYNPRAEYAARV